MVTVEQDVFRSAAMARDVIESYRQSHIAITGWSALLQESADTFTRLSAKLPVAGDSVDLGQLALLLSATVRAQLQLDAETLDRLSRDLQSIVATTRIPGVPRREDDDWSF
jgi:hypothetical protein